MFLFKKKLPEHDAAGAFVLSVLKAARDGWPAAYETFREVGGNQFVVQNKQMAPFDLALVAIAMDLQAVNNLFPKDQSERIEKWVFKYLSGGDSGEYAVNEVRQYSKAWQEAIENMTNNPASAVAARLLVRWLGDGIKNFDMGDGEKTGYISPLLLGATAIYLTEVALTWSWKSLKDKYKLIEGDLPPDFDTLDLKDYTPESDEGKPDGTIQYYDENGQLREKWVTPEQLTELKELLQKGGSRRVYKVLIKGPWSGVKEAQWELSSDNVKKEVSSKSV